MPNSIIYACYSSDKQTEDSIEAQTRACREYAAAKGFQVMEYTAMKQPAAKAAKPQTGPNKYQKMIRDCDKGLFDTILIHKYDRIARNLGEHVNLEKRLTETNWEEGRIPMQRPSIL